MRIAASLLSPAFPHTDVGNVLEDCNVLPGSGVYASVLRGWLLAVRVMVLPFSTVGFVLVTLFRGARCCFALSRPS